MVTLYLKCVTILPYETLNKITIAADFTDV